jgi:hypothetical protein
MSGTPPSKDWKLELRYGRLSTPYSHYTMVADGVAGELVDGFECPPGPAVMTMKVWATDHDEAFDMVGAIGRQIGFSARGKIELFDTPPEQPPGQNPHAYSIAFVPYEAD